MRTYRKELNCGRSLIRLLLQTQANKCVEEVSELARFLQLRCRLCAQQFHRLHIVKLH